MECTFEIPENGNATVTGIGLGSVAQYSCDAGYELEGISEQACLENGTWSGGQVWCECKLP